MARRGRSRWVRRAAAGAVAGVLLTVLAGVVGLLRYWSLVNGPAAVMTPDAIGFFVEGGSSWQWATNRVWGAEWTDMVAVGVGVMPPGTAASFEAAGIPNEAPAEWTRIRSLLVAHNLTLSDPMLNPVNRVGVGWPAPAFGSTYAFDDHILEGFDTNNFVMPGWYPSGRYECTILPTKVRWPAFLVDAAFWGLLVFAGLSAPTFTRAVRRGRRRRRGLCVACGYDLKGGGGKCPECGGA